jgi:TetR/AcrR family transcriptional regulator, transcriptional repressor for nem operon
MVTNMKVSREQAVANRERILDVASGLFREHGFDGIGVADLMKHAGLTHGGFYGHFSSKEDLMAQACDRALAESVAKWARLCAHTDGNPLSAIAKSYLSTRNRDDPGAGCAVAALGADVSRHGPKVRRSFTEGVRSLVEILAKIVPGKSRVAKRRMALTTFASMLGALVLARAVDDPELSEEILNAASGSIQALAS